MDFVYEKKTTYPRHRHSLHQSIYSENKIKNIFLIKSVKIKLVFTLNLMVADIKRNMLENGKAQTCPNKPVISMYYSP